MENKTFTVKPKPAAEGATRVSFGEPGEAGQPDSSILKRSPLQQKLPSYSHQICRSTDAQLEISERLSFICFTFQISCNHHVLLKKKKNIEGRKQAMCERTTQIIFVWPFMSQGF